MGLIYMRTSPNNKSYIGLTTQTEEMRWAQHCQEANNPNNNQYFSKLGQAIRKYGASNFTVKILEECPDSQLPEREIYWINYYNTYNNGYNETLGGEGYWKYDTKDILQLWNQGLNKKEIAKQIGCNEKTVRNHLKPLVSKDESYFRGQSKKIPASSKIEEILKLWNQGYSIQQIQEISKISCPTISKHLKLNNITEEEIKKRTSNQKAERNKKPIIQYKEDGTVIEYDSIKTASEELNIDAITLKNIIKGTSKKYKHIVLKWKEQI